MLNIIMNLIKKLKRFFYKLKNNDPVYKCPIYKKEGCSHVDGLLCYFPNCNVVQQHLGDKWVCCVNCKYQDECCSKQFGFGCYDGENY